MFVVGSSSGTLENYETRYMPMGYAADSNTESTVQVPMPVAGNLSKFYVNLDGSPGTGNSYTFTVRKNGADQIDLQVVISGSATSGSDTSGSVSFAAGDLISIESTPASSPTDRGARWSATFTPS
jgi:hypothetical protein